jgi:histidine ammonia-lyase
MHEVAAGSLTAVDVVAAARRELVVSLPTPVLDRIAASHRHARELASRQPLYGRATGVGANRDVLVTDPTAAGRALLRSHAGGAGPARDAARVRAALAVRLNQLAAGGSGVHPDVALALHAMLTDDALPEIHEWGGVGTGDLAVLARIALALLGELPTAGRASRHLDRIDDALAFISSNAATLGDAALAVTELTDLADAGLGVAVLVARATRANPEAFAAVVERATPFAGAIRVMRTLRSGLPGTVAAARIQDPFALRTLPQVHGAFLDALAALAAVVDALIAAPSENPLLIPGAAAAHHGGFQAVYAAQALDRVRSSLAQAAQLSTARLALLMNPAMTGQPAFLADGTPGASGAMILEYVAADALSELRALAPPAGVQTATLSIGAEEDASFAGLAARRTLMAQAPYATVLACELVAAVRALRGSGATDPAPRLIRDLLAAVSDLPASAEDRDLTTDLALATDCLPVLAQIMSSSGRSSSV